MTPELRRWWRLLDDLPERLGAVARWDAGAEPPPDADGQLHPTPTAVLCLAGVVRASRPGGHLDLHPGEGLVIGAGAWHVHEPARRGSVFFAQGFLPQWSDVVLGDHRQRWGGRLPREPSRRLLGAAAAADDPGVRRACFADLLRQVLAETVEDHRFADPVLRRMVRALWAGLHRGVTVADLVHASGLSRAQAYRVFTAGYGVPPKTALEDSRLELAESLLASGLGIGATARRCGFASPATFSRARRRRV